MLAVWLAYLLGKEQGRDSEAYPNGKPFCDFVIEAIAIVVVGVGLLIWWIGS